VNSLAAERVLREGVGLVHNHVAMGGEHGSERAAWVVNFDGNQSGVSPVEFEETADQFIEFRPGAGGSG
jgi:hypothetical protein